MRGIALTLLTGSVLAATAAPALGGPPATGRFSYEDQFVIQPGDAASCSFAVSADLQVSGSFQAFFDADGNATRVQVHEQWIGTLSANGRQVSEHGTQNELRNIVAGQIHDQVGGQGVLIHDSGLLRFDDAGNLIFEAGKHQGFDGDAAAIRQLCAALS